MRFGRNFASQQIVYLTETPPLVTSARKATSCRHFLAKSYPPLVDHSKVAKATSIRESFAGEGRIGMGQQPSLGASRLNQAQSTRHSDVSLLISRGCVSEPLRSIDSPVFTLGSGQDCDLVLGDDQFPELFAYILRTHDGYRLRCLADEPVLTVNAEDVVATRLENGDRIRCGPYEFHFQKAASVPAAQPSDAHASELTPPVAMRWTATDGQGTNGIERVHRLLRDIQLKIQRKEIYTQTHRRSA